MLRRVQIGLPEPRAWPVFGRANLLNAGLILLAPIPAIAATLVLFGWFPAGEVPPSPIWQDVRDADGLAAYLLHRPLLTLNVAYFAFVNVEFWLIALVQRSSWLIDPYWTLIPVFIAAFYSAHPLADLEPRRQLLAWGVLLVWSARLTWNYFRREAWRCGFREDWRYAKMRRERPGFWWEQFFVVHIAQHFMLVGLTLPFWAMAFHAAAPSRVDLVCFTLGCAGLVIAHLADDRLDRFMRENLRRVHAGQSRVWLLDSGIWAWSRHPNYFGEQLFWWSVGGFGVVCGQPWVLAGTFLNSCVLASVTVMTERRMLDVPERAPAYSEYRKRTSVWVPWPPRARAD